MFSGVFSPLSELFRSKKLEPPDSTSCLPGLPHITTGAFGGFAMNLGGSSEGGGNLKVGGSEGHWHWTAQGHILREGVLLSRSDKSI